MTEEELRAAVERGKERLRRAFAVANERQPGGVDVRFVAAVEKLPDLTELRGLNPICLQVAGDALGFEGVTIQALEQLQPPRRRRR